MFRPWKPGVRMPVATVSTVTVAYPLVKSTVASATCCRQSCSAVWSAFEQRTLTCSTSSTTGSTAASSTAHDGDERRKQSDGGGDMLHHGRDVRC
jgi:hypothetical protein